MGKSTLRYNIHWHWLITRIGTRADRSSPRFIIASAHAYIRKYSYRWYRESAIYQSVVDCYHQNVCPAIIEPTTDSDNRITGRVPYRRYRHIFLLSSSLSFPSAPTPVARGLPNSFISPLFHKAFVPVFEFVNVPANPRYHSWYTQNSRNLSRHSQKLSRWFIK